MNPSENIFEIALDYTAAGLSIIPIRGDGSKAPKVQWAEYQTRVAREDEVRAWFAGSNGDVGLAIIAFKDIEILDFDQPGLFDQFRDLLDEELPGVLERLPIVETPSGGAHVYYRCRITSGSGKLAYDAAGKTRIETRGKGGYVVAPPSPGCCHKSGRPYVQISGPALPEVLYITPEEREVLLSVARSFNQKPNRVIDEPRRRGQVEGQRPGDVYNAEAIWQDVLEPAGWTAARMSGNVIYWRKPGATGAGHHATTGHCGDKLYCFTTNGEPFEAEKAYTKFTAYALLFHAGNFVAAAQDLAAKGYGTMVPTQPTTSQAPPTVCLDTPLEAPDDPHRLARLYTEQRCRHKDGLTLRYWRGEWHRWSGTSYQPLGESEVRAEVCDVIKAEFNRVNLEELKDYEERRQKKLLKSNEERPTVRKVTQGLVGNVLQALTGLTVLPANTRQPAWVGDDGAFPADEILAATNGLIHLPSLVQGRDFFLPATPRFFSANVLDYAFDAQAPTPTAWLAFLEQMWPDDPQSIATLQDWFGYCLLPDTRLQKMLLLVGPKRSGKGTIARVLTGLVGKDNVAGPTLSGLATNFGLAPLLGKTVATISDARLSGRTDSAVITERLLSISGEDTLSIDRKHQEAVNVKLATRFMILTNELPRLNDSSGALAGRMVLLRLTQSWFQKEDPTLTDRLLEERPGILLWAIAGWQRLQQRKHFAQPDSGKELMDQLEDLTSPIGEFLRERCEIGPDYQVATAELYEQWRTWCGTTGRDHPGDKATFGRNLIAAVTTVNKSQLREGDRRVPTYKGIGLKGR